MAGLPTKVTPHQPAHISAGMIDSHQHLTYVCPVQRQIDQVQQLHAAHAMMAPHRAQVQNTVFEQATVPG
jgi:predicted amidohydrolase YtcJ